MKRCLERLYNGIIKENPTFVLMLGMCPTLAVTSSAQNGMYMGLATMFVLVLSNAMISAMRNIIPEKVRIPAFIVIVASFVTMLQMVLEAYLPAVKDLLGLYLPLIVVNCIILGRAESYASKNPVFPSLFDGLGMGCGFTIGLTLIGIFREIIGAGTVFGATVMPEAYTPIAIMKLAPGAFFVLACLTALQNKFKAPSATNTKADTEIACGGNCASCSGSSCASNKEMIDAQKEAIKAEKLAKAKAAAAAKAKAAEEAKANQE
ncbi:electron transport complex protein RnfE [Lachnospiraceae bacterium KM106-2]|nr:electron transport complex protein RnfE [Lachnospiraceae bacterium KM106-2]